MDREANLPAQSAPLKKLICSINPDSTSSSSSSSPEFLRHVQAAFKRHRPLGVNNSSSLKPRRILVPQRKVSKISSSSMSQVVETDKPKEVLSLSQDHVGSDLVNQLNNLNPIVKETKEDASITPPSISGTMTKTFDDKLIQFEEQRDGTKPFTGCKEKNLVSLAQVESQHVSGQKKVQFSVASTVTSPVVDDLMATGLEILSSHMGSLALTEMDWAASNQVEALAINHESNLHNIQTIESDIAFGSEGDCISSLLAKRTTTVQDQLQQFRNFLSHPSTQSSTVGPSYATTTSVHSTSAPMLNSATHSTRLHGSSHVAVELIGDSNANPQCLVQANTLQPSTSPKDTSAVLNEQIVVAPPSSSAVDTQMETNKFSQEKKGYMPEKTELPRNTSLLDDRLSEGKRCAGDVTDVRSEAPLSKGLSSDAKPETSVSDKQDKIASGKGSSVHRRRNYDPDLFFKVNGKLYQRLGKIGSGGSSEVHKVISSDCTIYALKKIKLKGRDYATAFGFCQEIGYLKSLKGMHNIIQLIDYEVTDKALLHEVMNGSISNKDGRVKDDGYIYMVLEYGEIDLAHMLSQKWKEMDNSNQSIDDNWLRFYWQQILLAVNTIHEERIVHSDLKPANFLLVKGSLKLIDFGIAKAIMSDTTNIQRDSQVGTLSYMSPEAFMCNETDENGNTIKCGRPSDIWSLGCILYQMVYGRTPFADYKTFWAKFKVITDPNHEILYEPVSNPWLLDIMKKCLAWDRNDRWRIPQLLQHPFLVPHISPQPSSSQDKNCSLFQLIAENCGDDPETSKLCSQLQDLLRDPLSEKTTELPTCRKHQLMLLSQMSKLCLQLEEHLANSESE